jgi:hypothetical protein
LKTCNKAQKTKNMKIIESGMKKNKKEGERTYGRPTWALS